MDGEDEVSAFDQAVYGQGEGSSNGRTPKTVKKRGSNQTRSGRTTKRRKIHDDYDSSHSDTDNEEEEVVSKPQSVREESSDEENDPDWRDAGRRTRSRPQTYNVKALFQNEMAKPRPTGAKRGRPRGSLSKKPNPRLPQINTYAEPPEKRELDAMFGMIPQPDVAQPDESERIFTLRVYNLEGIKMASGGFKQFINWITDQKTIDIYTYVADRYSFPEDSDDLLKIAQSLRHVWNKLPAATRRSWELAARQHAKAQMKSSENAMNEDGTLMDAPVMPVNEIPYKSAARHPQNTVAPMCCPKAEPWESFGGVKRHFLNTHYSSFFYACHFCMNMFETRKQLMEHTTCGAFPQFLINRIVSGKVEEPDATVCYLFMTCYECGLWVPIRDSYTGDKLEQAWSFFSTICRYHSNQTLNFLVVYAVDELVDEGPDSCFTFKFMPKSITNLPISCNSCEGVQFTSAEEANDHMLQHKPLTCKCGQQFGTEPHLRNHIFTHLPSKLTFSRYLRDSACVYPPATTQGLPRVGFHEGNVPAVGGSSKITENEAQFDFVDHGEPLLAEKLKNTMKRKKAAEVNEDDEEGFCEDQARADMGHEEADYLEMTEGEEEQKAKALLNKLFCKQMSEKSQFVWTDDMKNWAGISKSLDVSTDMTDEDISAKAKEICNSRFPMAEDLVHQFLQSVSLPTQACFDSLSEGILNRNYDICDECNVIFESGLFKHNCDSSKVFPIYRTDFPSNSRLSCHLCDEELCSIYGLRAHYAWDHLRNVESVQFLNVSEKKVTLMQIALENLTRDSRSLLARKIDVSLKMGPTQGKLRLKTVARLPQPYQLSYPPARRPMIPMDARRYPVSTRPLISNNPPASRGTVKPYLEGNNGRVGYTCRFCQFSTADMRKMREHLRISHTIICRGCGQAFAYQTTLTEHERICHRPFGKVPVGNMFGSCVCCRRKDPLPRLYTHIFESHLNLICYGTSCGKIYRRDTNTAFVKDIHVPAVPQMAVAALKTTIAPSPPTLTKEPVATANFECYLCGFESPTAAEHNKHMVRHTESFTICPFCFPPVPISSHDDMKNHLRTVHYRVKDAHHVCNFCAQVQDLNNVSHSVYHCVMSKRCALCPYSPRNQFETPEELRAHWRAAHHKQFHRFGCSECKQTFPSLGAFKTHTCKLVEMAHRCDCGEVFSSRGAYVDHFWVHVDAQRTHCQLCSVKFTQTLSIGQHRMNHGKLCGSAKQRKIKILDESLFIDDCKEIVEVVELDNDSNDSYPAMPSPTSEEENLELAVEKVVRKLVKDTCMQLGEAFEEGEVDDTDDALNAAVRTEQIDQQDVSHHPGYIDDGDDLEYCPSPSTNTGTAILRTVQDDNADDDICVVAEVEHPMGTMPSTVACRDKKFKCGMCSLSFVTKASLTEHEVKSHKNDVGGTLDKAYGMPLEGQTWLCRNCCVAFESPAAFRRHSAAHGLNSGISCPQCSGISYNYPLFEQHQACHRKTDKSRMLFGCGTCMKMFYTDARLYHHMNVYHQIPLLFFCKCCSITSSNLNVIFDHINKNNMCRSTLQKKNFKFLQMLGVFPANLVHYQPNNPEAFEGMLRSSMIKAVRPSECSHRSFLTLTDSVITCKECHCTMSSASFYANEAFLNNGVYKEMTVSLDDSFDFPFQREFQNHQVTKHRLIYNQATGVHVVPDLPTTVRHKLGTQRYMPVAQARPLLPPVSQARLLPPPTSQARPLPSPAYPNAKIAMPAYALKPGSVVATVNKTGVRTNIASSTPTSTAAIIRSGGRPRIAPRPGVSDDDIITLDDTPSTSVTPTAVVRPQAPVQKSNHCNICRAAMTGPKVKRLHDLHRSGKAWFCLDCASGQNSEEDVVKHYYTTHIPDGQTSHVAKGTPGDFRPMVFDLHCPFNSCKQPVKTLNELRKHLDVAHTEELKFHSSHCTSKFATEEALKAHEKAHEDFDDISGGMGGMCCQLCGVANQWNLQCEIMGAPKMISHLAMHGLHTYSMCRDCFTCFPGDFDNFKMIKHYEAAHATAAGVGKVRCNLCALDLTKEQLPQHGLEKHIVRGYKTRAKAHNQLMVKATGITRHFMGLPHTEEDDDS